MWGLPSSFLLRTVKSLSSSFSIAALSLRGAPARPAESAERHFQDGEKRVILCCSRADGRIRGEKRGMLATGRRRAVAGGVVLLLILAALLYFFLTRGGSAAPTAPAHLQVYVGTVQVAPTSGNFSTATNGATLNEGDTVKTLAQSKAAINYSDGSLTRLDSDTRVQLKVIDHPGVSYNTQLAQTTGKSWNRVKKLVG